jgi:uncharacterized membrane protein
MRRRSLLALALGATLVASVTLRFVTRSDLWFDEALSVNIASLPLGQISDALRHDGHPPLYYFLLHFWIDAFGDGDLAVRSLSGILSLATLPLAWFAGRRLGGRTVAWIAVFVVALSPYAFRYATEARMYALVMLFVAAGYLALRRALEAPTFARLVLVAAITAGLVLTQYWDLYLVAIVGAALLWRALRVGDAVQPRTSWRVFGAVAVGSLAFAAWLPVFLDQIGSTGTPWGDPQFPWVVVPSTLIAYAGSNKDGEAYMLALLLLVLPLLAVFGRGLDERRIELDLRTRPTVRWEAATAVGVLLLGAAISYVTDTTFAPRYAACIFPLVALVAAFGITVFVDERLRVAVLVIIAVLGIAGGVRNVVYERTQAGLAADVIERRSQPGDVVAYCSDQLGPDVSRLLRGVPGLEQVTFPDLAGPEFVNWSDYLERVQRADPDEFVSEVLDRAGDHTVWFVWSPGLNHLERECTAIGGAFDRAREGTIRVFPDDEVLEVRALTEYPAP